MFGKQDPYIEIEVGKQKKKTKTSKDGDRSPEWNQDVDFKIKEDNPHVKFRVMNDNVGPDELIATLRVPVAVLIGISSEHWIPLFKEDSNRNRAGKLLVKAVFEGTCGIPAPPNPSKFGLLSAHFGIPQYNLTADVLGFLEKKVADLKLTFKENEPLSGYFGFDPLDKHKNAKKLTVSFLRNGEAVNVEIGENHKDCEIVLEDYQMREAEAKNALLAEQAAYAKKAAENLEKAKAEAEARAKKEAEIKAAYMEQVKKASADLKSANELNLRTAQNLAFAQAKVEELKRKQEELENKIREAEGRANSLQAEKTQKCASFLIYGQHYRIKHKATGQYLCSKKGVHYQGGSKQQEVGCGGDAKNQVWVFGNGMSIFEQNNTVRNGDRVMNGDYIQLTHVESGNRLHNHDIKGHMCHDQLEVTCFEGRDLNDDWKFECKSIPAPGVPFQLVNHERLDRGTLHSHHITRGFNEKWQDVTTWHLHDDNDWWIAEPC